MGTLRLGQAFTVWVEQWLGAICRSLPSFLGFGVRFVLYRGLFARLEGFCFIYPGAYLTHTYGIRVGRNLHMNGGAFLDGRGGLTIGSDVLIGPNSVLLSSQHHWSDPTLPIVLQGHRLAPTTIGDDVWIGANVVVTPGVHIATGTVVGAGSIVTGDTEPYSIVVGVPARMTGKRPRPT
jgi:maltose O-acetyltransferase